MSNVVAQHSIWSEKIWKMLIKRNIAQEKVMQEKMGVCVDEERLKVMVMSTLITYKFVIQAFHQNENLGAIKKMERKYNVTIPEMTE